MLDLALLVEAAGAVAEHEEPTAFGLGPGAWVALSMIAVFSPINRTPSAGQSNTWTNIRLPRTVTRPLNAYRLNGLALVA